MYTKKFFQFCLAISCISGTVIAQDNPSKSKDDSNRQITVTNAQFPGGKDAFNDYILQEIVRMYEEDLVSNFGTVLLNFTIDTGGSVSDVQVMNGIDSVMDLQCIESLRKMPRWIPCYAGKYPTSCSYMIPFSFKDIRDKDENGIPVETKKEFSPAIPPKEPQDKPKENKLD